MRIPLELLSPAGSPEAVIAAVQSGADAIYMGLQQFNARSHATNFTTQEFLQSVEYCRVRGCKVYVTLNTLVSDREMNSVVDMAIQVSEGGADAILVQDLGVASVIHSVCPDIALHGSTQMSVHSLAGVYAAAELGMKRVVLARELNIDEIAFICQHAPIEIEVFVHGALCVCHSGQCYMSSLIGRRSGNRGACAQPCRLPYGMGRRMNAYPLSLKDNCLIDHLQQLADAGVRCVKIEGRSKRPEYTALTTKIYARALSQGTPPTERDRELLEQIFSRSGFTDAYLQGKQYEEDMHGTRGDVAEGDALFESPQRLYASIRKEYTGVETRRVPVKFTLSVQESGSALTVSDPEENAITIQGPVPQIAQRNPLTVQDAEQQLYKTGGTPYLCDGIQVELEHNNFYLPLSAINDMRRQALSMLSEMRRLPPEHRSIGEMPPRPEATARPAAPVLTMQFFSENQLTEDLAKLQPSVVYVPIKILYEHFMKVSLFLDRGCEVCAVLPRIITDSETEPVIQLLEKIRGLGIFTALVGNLGHIAIARKCRFRVRGDFGLNVFNSYSMDVLRKAQLISCTASFELRLAQIRDLIHSLPTEAIVYGRLPCMITDQDLITQSSGSRAVASANLTDRMGMSFPVLRDGERRNVIYNAHKLFLGDRPDDIAQNGLWAGRLLFTNETPRECLQVALRYTGQSNYTPYNVTRGLYYRGIL